MSTNPEQGIGEQEFLTKTEKEKEKYKETVDLLEEQERLVDDLFEINEMFDTANIQDWLSSQKDFSAILDRLIDFNKRVLKVAQTTDFKKLDLSTEKKAQLKVGLRDVTMLTKKDYEAEKDKGAKFLSEKDQEILKKIPGYQPRKAGYLEVENPEDRNYAADFVKQKLSSQRLEMKKLTKEADFLHYILSITEKIQQQENELYASANPSVENERKIKEYKSILKNYLENPNEAGNIDALNELARQFGARESRIGVYDESRETVDVERIFREAKEKFGESYFGPDEIETYFTLGNGDKLFEYSAEQKQEIARLLQEKLNDPQIRALIERTSMEELKNKFQLFIFPDKFKDGSKVTMKSLNEKFQPEMTRRGLGKLLYDTDWYQNEEFFTSDSNQLFWKLLSKGNIEGSQDKNYFDETKFFREYLRQNNLATADELNEASDEKLAELKQLNESDWKESARQLSELKINQNYRINPLEIVFIDAVQKSALTNTHARTAKRSSDGKLISAGSCDVDGAGVSRWRPGSANGTMGISFSR